MKLHIATHIDDIPVSPEQWDRMVENNETDTIFQTYSWFKSWWDVFQSRYELFFLSARHDGELIGFAPLAIKKAARGDRELVFAGDGNADYMDFVVQHTKEEVLREFIGAILQHADKWHHMYFRNIPGYSTTPGLLKKLSYEFKISAFDYFIACPTLVIRSRGNDVGKLLNKYSVKRPLNYFTRHGTLTHSVIDDSGSAHAHLEGFFQQHIERWQKTNHPSLFLREHNRALYRKLVELLLPEKRLLFSVVEFDGTPIAYHFGFDYNGVVTWYKPAFNVKYAKHSPGILLIRFLLEYAFRNNRKELDFTIGDEAFKNRFTNAHRFNTNIACYKDDLSFLINRLKMLVLPQVGK